MIGNIPTVNVKEHEITTTKIAISHNRCPSIVVHFVRRAGQLCCQYFVVGVKNQPTAVKPGIRIGTSPQIGLSQLLLKTMDSHFSDVVQMIAAKKMRVLGERLPMMIAGFKWPGKSFRVLLNQRPILLAQRLLTLRIPFHNRTHLLFQLGVILLQQSGTIAYAQLRRIA